MKRMSPAERRDWIVAHLKQMPARSALDVLDREFVDAYVEATGATESVTMYGANKCPTLGRDLAALAKSYRLRRARTGIEGMAGMGFPSWVWSYRLPSS